MRHMPDVPDSLASLEGQKAGLLRKISKLGEFRTVHPRRSLG